MRYRRHRLIITLAFVSVLGVLPSFQDSHIVASQDAQQQPPRIRAGANFVRVDTYPTRNGQPVLDLQQEEFEVFEDGVPQKIESFEHVVANAGGPVRRPEVSSQRESLAAAANPRNRVFVIFLDVPHLTIPSAHQITEPLIRLLNRILGPDDLVGIMTPAMAASQIVLGRNTQILEEGLRNAWPHGRKETMILDERERAYSECYPPLSTERGVESKLANDMIQRKRERATLEALSDLVNYLRSIREERKAIITVTEAWKLYGPADLMKLREDPNTGYKEPIPGTEPITVGPNGKLTTKADPRRIDVGSLTKTECDADRMFLSNIDDRQYFLDLLDEANAANASFYPVDARGLVVFDTPIQDKVSLAADAEMLRNRLNVFRTMAENTDGIAVINNNDLDKGLKKISDDMSSYYLLGYSSTNTKLDGRFRALKVRVKRSGVDVRARRGYKAASEEEVLNARKAADAPLPEAAGTTRAAIDKLARIRPEARFYLNAVADPNGKVWVAGEIMSSGGRPDEFAQGGTADVEVTLGSSSTTARVPLKPGERTFITSMAMPAGASGELNVKARVSPTEGGSVPLTDLIHVEAGKSAPQPLMFRRGATTGNRLLPAADFRFSRTERLRMEIPVAADIKPGAGRVLDRLGQPSQVAVTMSERTDATTGQKWVVADVTLGALALADYALEVELVGGPSTQKVISGIRITR